MVMTIVKYCKDILGRYNNELKSNTKWNDANTEEHPYQMRSENKEELKSFKKNKYYRIITPCKLKDGLKGDYELIIKIINEYNNIKDNVDFIIIPKETGINLIEKTISTQIYWR
jgi:hypothetical protein